MPRLHLTDVAVRALKSPAAGQIYGRPVRKELSFTRREIGPLIGRKEWGGRDSEQLSRALHEIHYTFIRTHFKNADGRHVEHSFNIFPEIFLERREFASDPIEACTI